MSVLHCRRSSCQNIMCDRYSKIHGHICDSCFDELVSRKLMTENELLDFMAEKDKQSHNVEATYTYFDSIFKKR